MTTEAPGGAKVDRDDVFLELTKSICPVCKRVIDAEVNIRGGRVIMSKRCPSHGPFEALVYSDAELYLDYQRFNKPGTIPLEFATEVREGCPLDCGLCPDHKQHTCIALIEVNTGCNLDCPICFADSGHQPDGFSLNVEQVEFMLDRFIAQEGQGDALMFSGGEPTIHPDILTFIELARERDIGQIFLNTNAIRLARDRRFVEALAELDPFVYFQFDGLELETHLAIRGKDLREEKERALDVCSEVGLRVALVAAIEKGVNEHEIGAIVRHAVKHPAPVAAVFQPVTHSGRHIVFDPLERLTNADVMKLIAAQVPEWFRVSDFVPVPCCSPTCRSQTYALIDKDGLVPITRLLDVEPFLDYVSNRFLFDPDIRGPLEHMFSTSAEPGFGNLTAACESCGLDLTTFADAIDDPWQSLFGIVIQDFLDPYTLNVRQLMKCCVGELTPDGRMIPFCAYNSVGYREQVREQLSGVPVELMVPHGRELLPVLQPTQYGSQTVRLTRSADGPRDARNVGKRLS
ncbi:MAG: radical SAM protein [Actinomycetia bacterium]|nr:radical SAM protein [Actinomycetes bacterium]